MRAFLTEQPETFPWSKHLSSDLAPDKPYPLSAHKFSDNTHFGMRQLFLRTATHGTARKYVNKTVYNYNRRKLNIGGKTGSLDGLDPKGRYDWFAGFAQSKEEPNKSVVIVVMQVHDNLRTLPATGVAGVMINHWAKEYLP
ncbi:MAG: hypothetical protein GX801_06650 [Fibrobacter sp.]|nr:hypothetical protein [Fibrobacter sp.]